MPIYEYECKRCHKITEALQKFSDAPFTECPHCEGRLNKLISLTSFHLKGSGWYVTDYAGKNAGNQAANGEREGSVKEEKTSQSKKDDVGATSSSET